MALTDNRLMVLGSKRDVQAFRTTNWQRQLRARHFELLESSPGRFACQFETDTPPLKSLNTLSRRWPRLIFLVDYESEEERIKGLAKAKADELEHFEIKY